MKKAIAVSFLMLANIMILAHAVMPHHHHENAGVYFIDSHCEYCKEVQNHEHHNIPNHLCGCEGNPSESHCIIDHIYIPAYNHTIKSTVCHIHSKCKGDHVLETLVPNSLNIHDFADKTLIPFQQKLYAVAYHTDHIAQSLGLRAPPSYI